MPKPDPRIADIVASGAVRLALFLPQFSVDATSAVQGHGTGVIALALMRALAGTLGIAMQVVQCPTPTRAVEALNSGAADVAFPGIEPSRAEIVDFTPAVFEFEYGFMVPPGSTLAGLADIDRPGTRIAIVGNHASSMALARLVKHADLIKSELPDQAFALIRDGKVDVFAMPRDILVGFAQKLPGAKILEKPFGFNRVGIAVAKGRTERRAFFTDYVAEAKRSGMIQKIIDENRAELPGFRVASP